MRDYTSASEINCLLDNPSAWLLAYKYGYRGRGSAAMQRGLDVEYAITCSLIGGDYDTDCLDEIGQHMYHSGLPVIEHLTDDGESLILPDRQDNPYKQWKIRIDDPTLPMIGYLDYVAAPDDPCGSVHIIDTKCTANAPAKFPSAHARQAAIYQWALNEQIGECQYRIGESPLAAMMPSGVDVSFVYMLKRKQNPIIIYTTKSDLEVPGVAPENIRNVSLYIAYMDAQSTWQLIKRWRNKPAHELRNNIPVNTDHYRFSGYNEDIIMKLKLGTLEQKLDEPEPVKTPEDDPFADTAAKSVPIGELWNG